MAETTEQYRNRINQLNNNIKNEPGIVNMRDDIAEGISKTGNRQADIENQFQSVIDGTTGKDIISAPEILAARTNLKGESFLNLKAKNDAFEQETFSNLAQTPTASPETYGAVGDGVTDDTQAVQDLFNNTNGFLFFPKGKRYLIKSSVIVDCTKIRGVQGNRSMIVIDGDFDAFIVQGTLPLDGNSHPASAGIIAVQEAGTFIEGFIFTSKTKTQGTGINVDRAFGVTIAKNVFLYIKNAIIVPRKSRNLVIEGNHIFALKEYGIYFGPGGDSHQINIYGNQISYCKKNIFGDNHDIYNMQITGNDIETGPYDNSPIHNIHLFATTAKLEDIEIVGNTIEDHWNTNEMVRIESSAPENAIAITISGNTIGNSYSEELVFRNVRGLSVSGNVFKKSYGYSIKFIERSEGVTITGNSFYSAGILTVYGTLVGFVFLGNVGFNITKNPIILNGDASSDGFYSLNISDNAIHMASSGTSLSGYLFDINIKIIEAATIKGNTIRARPYTNNGMRVSVAEKVVKSIIKDNVVFDLPTGKTTYNLPTAVAGQVVVSDNI